MGRGTLWRRKTSSTPQRLQRHRRSTIRKSAASFSRCVLILSLVLGIWWIADNTVENLRRSNISTGFDFLRGRAGFDIGLSMIHYSSNSTFARALVAGF